ncbi:MAG: hypothetical protein ABR968_13620 [Bacteroidales bacterium]
MPDRSRIPRNTEGFVHYLDYTDEYQKDIDPATGNPRYENWGWTAFESAQWTQFRTDTDRLYAVWTDTKLRSDSISNELRLQIINTVSYDHEHHLLDRIAVSPMPPVSITDFNVFNIKKGTPLEDDAKTPASSPGMQAPSLFVRHVISGAIQLYVSNPDKPRSVAIPKGIKEIEVWQAEAPFKGDEPTSKDYTYVGGARYGKYIALFTGADTGNVAYFKARYKNSRGEHGPYSVVVSSLII